MTIKEIRNQIGWSQANMAAILNIPKRTIENWESGVSTPPPYVETLIINEIDRRMQPKTPAFSIRNESVKRYADICKKFAHDTAEWSRLVFENFYTTDGSFDWSESSDNAHNGIDVSWAYGLEDYEIEYAAAERLFEFLQEEIQLAVDDEWDIEDLSATIDKYNI